MIPKIKYKETPKDINLGPLLGSFAKQKESETSKTKQPEKTKESNQK